MTFYIKRNDTSAGLELTLKDSAGVAVNLTGATSSNLHVVNAYGQTVLDTAISIYDAANGVVRYAWQTGDITAAGIYRAEVEITYADGTIQTFPNNSFYTIEVERDLA